MEKENKPTFIQWIKEYNGVFTYCNELKSWVTEDRKLKKVTDKDSLKAHMKRDKYFKDRHFRKVDVAFEIYTDEMRKLAQ